MVVVALCTGTATAVAEPPRYLDLVDVNPDGSESGGLNPALPLDRVELETALHAARASGTPPSRYATLLHQYWLVVAADNADIDLADWDPHLGLTANRATIDLVYVNYLRMTNAHPELYWSGMAGLAGVSFAAGFYDLGDVSRILGVDAIHQIASAVAGMTATLPPGTALPDDLERLVRDGPRMSQADVDWYIERLLTMQKHIFIDLAPMHEAYIAEGANGINELDSAGLLDDNMVQAWRSISEGSQEGFADALVRMASREQNQIIADQWDVTAGGRDGMGRVLTYVTTLAGKPAVPGTRAPGTYAPTDVTVNTAGGPTAVTAPLPNFNWADREPRWKFISDELAPCYITAVQQQTRQTASLLATPFAEMSERGRLIPRLPDLLHDLTTGWTVRPVN